MNRLITILLLLLSSICFADSAVQQNKPNILFIAIDDMNDWVGYMGGHPQAVTPNLDALAAKGVVFDNATCPAPGCSPSRNALLYGIEPFNSGLYAFYDNEEIHVGLQEKYISLPRFLKENGYGTFGAGKIHHGYRGKEIEWTDYHQPTSHKLNLDVESGYQVNKSFKMSFCPTTNPYDEHPDHKVASYGIDVLKQKHDKPFFLAVGIVKPHLPFICPKEFFDLYPDPVDPPRILENDLADIPWVGKSMAKLSDDNRFKKDNAWDKVRRAYLACNSWADYNIGRVLDALEESPYADNTIIVLWSDHGYGQGEKRHFRKFALWEETTRVPFIIWDRREKKTPEGRIVKDGVSLINIYKTLAEMTGLDAPAYLDGYSLVPYLKDTSLPLPTPSICSWGRGNYALRDADYRYIRYFDGSEELYSHEKDPDEWTNLADNPEYAAVKDRMAKYFPANEAPLFMEYIADWSITTSADKPDKKKK
jgi:arylsulfatase A-like enzyme